MTMTEAFGGLTGRQELALHVALGRALARMEPALRSEGWTVQDLLHSGPGHMHAMLKKGRLVGVRFPGYPGVDPHIDIPLWRPGHRFSAAVRRQLWKRRHASARRRRELWRRLGRQRRDRHWRL